MLDNHWTELKQGNMLYIDRGKYSVKKISCDFEGCEKYFRDKHDKKEHVLKHLKKRALHCDQCPKTFYTTRDLNTHKRSLHVVDPTICQECGITLPNKSRLKLHSSRFHPQKPKKEYKCQHCDFISIHMNSTQEHERIHTGERPDLCKFCGKGFTSKGTLRNHERLHTGVKPYVCRYCDSRFVQRNSAKVHVNTHHKTEVANAGPKDKHYTFQPQ